MRIEDQPAAIKKKIFGSIGIIAAVIVAVIFIVNCLYKISPGMAGIVYNLDGGIEGETLGQGIHIVLPWKKIVEYPVSTETVYYLVKKEDNDVDNGIDISTKDGKTVHVSVTYAFHMDEAELPKVFTKFRGQPIDKIEAGYMKSELLRCINEVTAQYDLMAVVGDKRAEINSAVFNRFKDSLGEFGVVVETLNIADAKPDSATADAIQRVIDAQNKLQQATIEKQTAEQEAEKRIIEAKGKAEAAKLEAEGIAAANERVRESLSPTLIQQHAIEKWDGKVPQVNGNGAMMFNIPLENKQ